MHLLNIIYYSLRPCIPRSLQVAIRRRLVQWKRKRFTDVWPISPSAARPPDQWDGWPGGKRFALVLQHDVEFEKGVSNIPSLMALEESLGFRSSYGFVPERYRVPASLRTEIRKRGFEVCVHGLKHDGKLFLSRRIFLSRAVRINAYLRDWKCEGFTSPAAHHKLHWMHDLDIGFGTSTFDTDPFEPQPDGVDRIFPFWVEDPVSEKGYLEMPYTMPQDFTLFILMGEKNIDIWKRKADWIAEHGGMLLLKTHPDYMNFGDHGSDPERYPSAFYRDFLVYMKNRYQNRYWNATETDIAGFWRTLRTMRAIADSGWN